MKKSVRLLVVLMLGVMIFASGSAVLAGDSLTGNWSGTWTCPQGEIKSGPMHGNLNQNGKNLTGNFTLQGTVEGTISGPLTGTATGGIMVGDIKASGWSMHLDGRYTANTLNGNYSGPLGNGGFNLKRQ